MHDYEEITVKEWVLWKRVVQNGVSKQEMQARRHEEFGLTSLSWSVTSHSNRSTFPSPYSSFSSLQVLSSCAREKSNTPTWSHAGQSWARRTQHDVAMAAPAGKQVLALALCFSNKRVVASPSPWAAPVTRATFPANKDILVPHSVGLTLI